MTDYTDLVRRLRDDEPEYAVRRSDLRAAADAIEQLQTELAEARTYWSSRLADR